MSSATGIPAHYPDEPRENEPLLGQRGDVTQEEDTSIISNLWLGTGWISLVGAVLLVLSIWLSVFLHPLLPLVSPHPLLNSLGVLALTLAIQILQPTWSPSTKRRGQIAHASLNLFSFLCFTAGATIILVNKHRSSDPHPHFHSVHAYLGLVSVGVLVLQYAVGLSMWAFPALYGGEERAKRVWKYHRIAGYVIYLLLLGTVTAATFTPYASKVLELKTWSVAVAAGLCVVGVYPRVSLTKFGFRRENLQ